jgi:hypothetical protein
MIPDKNILIGELKVSQIIDTRGVGYSPFGLPENTPMLNPVSWELLGEWEDGWHINQVLFRVENNKIVEAYSLSPLNKDNGDLLGNPFKMCDYD